MLKKTRLSVFISTIGYALVFLCCLIGIINLFLHTCYAPGYDPVKYPYIIDEVIKFEFLIAIFIAVVSAISCIKGLLRLNKENFANIKEEDKTLTFFKLLSTVSALMMFLFHVAFIKENVAGTDYDVHIVDNPVLYFVLPILLFVVFGLVDVKPNLKWPFYLASGLPVYVYGALYATLFYFGAWKDFYNVLTNKCWGGDTSFNVGMLFIVLLVPIAFGFVSYFSRKAMDKFVFNDPIVEEKEPAKFDTWVCPKCGEETNTGSFCVRCGDPKPENSKAKRNKLTTNEEWTCPHCGMKNVGNFCANCGIKQPVVIAHTPLKKS